jgi:hypothetical protein
MHCPAASWGIARVDIAPLPVLLHLKSLPAVTLNRRLQ